MNERQKEFSAQIVGAFITCFIISLFGFDVTMSFLETIILLGFYNLLAK